MKNVIRITLFAAALFIAANVSAQDSIGDKIDRKANKTGNAIKRTAKKVGDGTERTAKKVGNGTEKTAKKVGNKTAEVASEGASKVSDKTFAGKVAPGGETVYIDKNSKYYYVNSKGRHVYVTKAQLKDKKD